MSIKNGAGAMEARALPATGNGDPEARGDAPGRISWIAIGMALASTALVMVWPEGQRGLLTLSVFGILFCLLVLSPAIGAPAALVYLSVVGGVRRWLLPLLGFTPADPLLLVGPALVSLYFANLLLKRRLPGKTRLSRLLFPLLAVMVLEMGNPLQGGLAVGLAGALFYIVPILWYFVGRTVGSPALLRRLFSVTIGIAICGALYGLYQTWFGFTAGEEEWFRLGKGKYIALMIGGNLKAFSFFTSGAEYIGFLGWGIVLLWAAVLRGSRASLLPIPLLALAVFLVSSRTIIVSTLTTCAVLWAVQGRDIRSWLPRGLLALALAGFGLVWSLTQLQEADFGGTTEAIVEHQSTGLLNPLDPNKSTGQIHIRGFLGGIASAFHNPLGRGLGATTLASGKFGALGGSTEVDLSDVFVSLGLVGGLLYAAIIAVVLASAFRCWRRTRSLTALRTLGILFLALGSWLSGARYAACMLIWLVIGTLDRVEREAAP